MQTNRATRGGPDRMKGLTGKRIVIAGSASGIGAATARRLAEEGARVVLGDINTPAAGALAESIRKAGGQAVAKWFDLAERDSIASLMDECIAQFGGIDGLVNVAADLSPETVQGDTDLLSMEVDLWQHVLKMNLVGFVHAIRAALPHLVAQGGGSIVNVSSAAAWMGMPVFPAYASSKIGGHALMRHVARRWGSENVRCNSVAPGQIMTEAARKLRSADELAEMQRAVPLPRLGVPEDIGSAIAFLMSDDAAWITGQVWSIDGGMTCRE
ncbi:MAG: SDR family NAD(P)-dependent oxidoreductase [Pseudomonadota bacterium]|nr:SDR family NAD(P)-dependent oxidoreductase [Pseudomonadota bacterium]